MVIINFIKKLTSLFSIFEIPVIPIYGEIEKQQHVKQIVRKLARGNAYLQLGYYETKEDILEQKIEIMVIYGT